MKKHKKIKLFATFLLICVVTVCAFGVVGQTTAFYTGTDSVENKMVASKVNIEVEEKVKGLSKTEIKISNPYGSPCYVRMKIMIPQIAGLESKARSDFDGFVKGSDGFYYLNKILRTGEHVKLGNDDNPVYSANFEKGLSESERKRIESLADVVIYVEAIQAAHIVEDTGEGTAEGAMKAFAKLN